MPEVDVIECPSIGSLARWANQEISRSEKLGSENNANADVIALLESTCGISAAQFYAHPEASIDQDHYQQFFAAVAQRVAGRPIAYIVGSRGFHALDIHVDERVLIPRPETELLVDAVLERAPADPFSVLDLGTGSGAIALAIAHAAKRAQVIGVDKSRDALNVAKANALSLDLSVQFIESDWFEMLPSQCYDVIVSNPPYIRTDDPHMPLLATEPLAALDGGPDGLEDFRTIVSQASDFLAPSGLLYLEHGYDQGAAVASLARHAGMDVEACLVDAGGHDRVSILRRRK